MDLLPSATQRLRRIPTAGPTPADARSRRRARRSSGSRRAGWPDCARVDVILSSPNQRTWHTAEILAELDCWPAPEPSPALRTGSRRGSPEGHSALEDYANAKSVAVVGHKPRLKELAAYLLTGEGDGMKIKIRQGSVTCIRFDGAPAPGTGKLHWLLHFQKPSASSWSALQLVSIPAFPARWSID